MGVTIILRKLSDYNVDRYFTLLPPVAFCNLCFCRFSTLCHFCGYLSFRRQDRFHVGVRWLPGGQAPHSHMEDLKSWSGILRCERNITFKGGNAWRESLKKGLCLFLIKETCPAAGPLPIPGTTLIRLRSNLLGVQGTFGQHLPSLVKTALFVDVFDSLSEKEFSGMCNT